MALRFNYEKAKASGYSDQQIQEYLSRKGGVGTQTPATTQPQGRGLLDLLSVGTSIGGGVLGSALGPLGTVGGAAAGGGLGELLEQYLSKQKVNLPEAGTEALWGGAGAGVGLGVGRLLGGVGKVGGELTKGTIRGGVKAGSGYAQTVDEQARLASQYGLKGSAVAKAGKAAQARTVVRGELGEMLSKSKALNYSTTKNYLRTKMLNSVQGSDTKEYKRAVDFYLKQLSSSKPSKLLELRDRLYPLTQSKSAIPSARSAAVKEMYDGLNDLLRKVPDERVGGLLTNQKLLHTAEEVYSKQAGKSPGSFFGITIPGRPVQAAEDFLGRVATGAGGGGRLSQILSQAGGQAGARTFRPRGGDMQPGIIEPQSIPEVDTSETQGKGMSNILQQLALLDLMRGGKNITKIIALSKFLNPPVSAAQQGQVAQISAAEGLIDQLESGYSMAAGKGQTGFGIGPLSGLLGGVSGGAINQEAALYNSIRAGFTALIARATGERGVLTDADAQRALSLMPSLNDSPQLAQNKLNQIRQVFQNAKARISSGGETNDIDSLLQFAQ